MAEHGKRARDFANRTGMKRLKKENASSFGSVNSARFHPKIVSEAWRPNESEFAQESRGGDCKTRAEITSEGSHHPDPVGEDWNRFHAPSSLDGYGRDEPLREEEALESRVPSPYLEASPSRKGSPRLYSSKEHEDAMAIDKPRDTQDHQKLEEFYVNIKQETSELSALERERREHTSSVEDLKTTMGRQQRDLSNLLKQAAQLQKAIMRKKQGLEHTTRRIQQEEDGARRCTEEIASRIMSRNSQINGH